MMMSSGTYNFQYCDNIIALYWHNKQNYWFLCMWAQTFFMSTAQVYNDL